MCITINIIFMHFKTVVNKNCLQFLEFYVDILIGEMNKFINDFPTAYDENKDLMWRIKLHTPILLTFMPKF